MPLDGHSYLVSQGWSGKGTGLRQGAITRPITISQKKSLAGLGKDRDEAFPFWDHLFSAASKSIQVKISNDDTEDTSDSDEESASVTILKRTTTGILCNRRPNNSLTSATTSGTSTPISTDAPNPKLSLIALAKREAAKRNLYSRFYRGPILGPESEYPNPSPTPGQSISVDDSPSPTKNKVKASEKEKENKEKSSRKKRKAEDSGENDEIEKRERKRRKKQLKQLEKLDRRKRKEERRKRKEERRERKEERRERKEERRERKEERKREEKSRKMLMLF